MHTREDAPLGLVIGREQGVPPRKAKLIPIATAQPVSLIGGESAKTR